jgi:AcrR family transcriptional regulator
MRSAPTPSDANDITDTADSGRVAIVQAAVDLLGRNGPDGTTVRAIAEVAGVSAPLVIHHFGSKQGLVEACDAHVRAVIRDVIAGFAEHPDEVGMMPLLAQSNFAPALAYVARSLHDDGDVGRWWFDEMMRMTTELYPAMLERGAVREVSDPEMTALLLVALDFGLVLLRSHVERRIDAELTDPAVLERWLRAELDLLTHGLFVPPGKDER